MVNVSTRTFSTSHPVAPAPARPRPSPRVSPVWRSGQRPTALLSAPHPSILSSASSPPSALSAGRESSPSPTVRTPLARWADGRGRGRHCSARWWARIPEIQRPWSATTSRITRSSSTGASCTARASGCLARCTGETARTAMQSPSRRWPCCGNLELKSLIRPTSPRPRRFWKSQASWRCCSTSSSTISIGTSPSAETQQLGISRT